MSLERNLFSHLTQLFKVGLTTVSFFHSFILAFPDLLGWWSFFFGKMRQNQHKSKPMVWLNFIYLTKTEICVIKRCFTRQFQLGSSFGKFFVMFVALSFFFLLRRIWQQWCSSSWATFCQSHLWSFLEAFYRKVYWRKHPFL